MPIADEDPQKSAKVYFTDEEEAPPRRPTADSNLARAFLIVTIITFALLPLLAYLSSSLHFLPPWLPRLP